MGEFIVRILNETSSVYYVTHAGTIMSKHRRSYTAERAAKRAALKDAQQNGLAIAEIVEDGITRGWRTWKES